MSMRTDNAITDSRRGALEGHGARLVLDHAHVLEKPRMITDLIHAEMRKCNYMLFVWGDMRRIELLVGL